MRDSHLRNNEMQSKRWVGAIGGRVRRGVAVAVVCALHAAAVHAQTSQDKHHLLAQAGNQFQGEVEVDRFDGRADFVWQNGVQGVNPSFFFHEAVADGDSGVLSIFSRFSRAGGPGDPILVDSSNRSVALIEETINPGTTTSDAVTVTARLHWNGSGSIGAGNGEVSAYLTVDQCSVGWTKGFSPLSQTSAGTECVGTATNFGTASAGLLTVTKVRATPIGSSSRFFVTAQIEGESSSGDYVSGEYEASGVLTIEVVGAPYEFSSPTFLTVPEPGDAAHAIAVIAALGALARRSVARSR
jgi:hypothetical protein